MERVNGVGWKLLTDAQASASRTALARESASRSHLVVSLSGAHAYGFPSPDSDVDLKAVHVAPTERLVGLARESGAPSKIEWIEGIEIDYSSNEIGDVLHGILKGNGNYLERINGHAAMSTSDELASLQPIATRATSKRVHRHYRGFAQSQLHAFDEKPTAKKLLYVLRTALTGTHLLRTGELVVDVTEILAEYGFADAHELVIAKRRGENVILASEQVTAWRARVTKVFETLDRAHAESKLPDEPPSEDEMNAWLIALRRARF